MRSTTRASLVLALSVSLSAPAQAAPPQGKVERKVERQARRLFEAGSLAYDKGRYGDAARAFGEAQRLFPRPAIAFSWAQSLRRQYFVDQDREHLVVAQRLLRAYLAEIEEGRRRADAVDQLQAIAVLLAATAPAPAPDPVAPKISPDGPAPNPEEPSASDPPEPPPSAEPAPPVPPPGRTELIVYSGVADAEASIDGAPFAAVPLIAATTAGPHEVVVRAPGYADVRSTETAVRGRIIPVEATLQPIPATVAINAIDGARVVLDGRELGFSPLAPVTVQPGTHRVSVTAPGRVRYGTQLTADRGESIVLDAETPHTVQRRIAWGMLGGAGGLAVTGGVTLGLALLFQARVRAIDEMRAADNLQPSQRERYNAHLDRRDALRGATVGLLSAAAVAGITGLVLVLTDRPGRVRRAR